MNTKQFRVAMFVNGTEVASSTVKAGSYADCRACQKRMNRGVITPGVRYKTVPCLQLSRA